ncbi:MAG TPA: putative metal-binding motif-containing protein, partial [Myxococcota bacterium]|nr:putative metal-binding motif-containing protein [Myxococcota bacterium]
MGRYLLGFTLFSLTLVGCDAGGGKDTAVGVKDDSNSVTPGCDEDGDGFCESENDCNEGDASINPGATEICDGIDNNCDDTVDEGVMDTFYADADGDGFGDANNPKELCEAEEGFVNNSSDCDDAAKLVFPGATEVCDGIDNNCDGSIDEGVTFTFYQDTDGDGHGDADTATQYCDAP